MRNFLSSVFLVLILSHSVIAQSGANTIAVGGKLMEGQRLYSPNKTHYLAMQADGNLCIYTSSDKFVWCSMAAKGSGSYLTMQADGNLVVNDRNNQPAWSTETQAYFDAKYGNDDWKPVRAALEEDGTLGLYTAANRKVWSSKAGKTDTGAAVASAVESLPVEGYTGPTVKKQLNIVLPFSKKAQNVEVEIADGKVIYQRDMILGDVGDFSDATPSNDPASNDDQSQRWPNSTIPYVIQAGHPRKDLILLAIKEVHDKTNLCVVPRTNQTDYVEFVSKKGNWAALGRNGGRQEISIEYNSMGSAAHEILHAAGFYHVQSREDRDNYVTINFGNIQEGFSGNFQKEGKETNIGAYDFGSIMHYPAKGFSKNGRNTIDVKNPQALGSKIMGQRDGLSAGDVAVVNTFYPPGACKPAGTELVSSTSGKLPTTSTQTTEPAGTGTNTGVPTRPTSTGTNTGVPTRPTSTGTNTGVPTRPTSTGTNTGAPTRPTGTGTNTGVPTRPTSTGTNTGVPTRPMGIEAATLKYQPRMKPGDRLIEGEKMVSANGQYQLRGTTDGNFVIEEVQTGRPVYTFPLSNPFGERPAKSYLSYNPDGNICIQSIQNKSYCATDGRDKVAPVILNKSIYAELTDNGRLILVDKEGREIWATTPGPPNTGGSLTNLALGKKATQSFNADSKYTTNAGPEKAVDGNTEAILKNDPSNSVAHIQPYKNYQHWEVDLGAVYDIDHIVIWNRKDCCWEELKNFIVTVSPTTIRWRIGLGGKDSAPVGMAQPVADGYETGLNIGPLSPAWTADLNSFTLKINRKGRYVCITIPDGTSTISLSLAEVQVFGK